MAEALDPQTHEELKRILAKDPNDMNDYDKGFLRARASYIGQRQKDRLADVFVESRGERKAREAREAESQKSKEEAEEQSRQDLNGHLEPAVEQVADEDDGPDEEAVG